MSCYSHLLPSQSLLESPFNLFTLNLEAKYCFSNINTNRYPSSFVGTSTSYRSSYSSSCSYKYKANHRTNLSFFNLNHHIDNNYIDIYSDFPHKIYNYQTNTINKGRIEIDTSTSITKLYVRVKKCNPVSRSHFYGRRNRGRSDLKSKNTDIDETIQSTPSEKSNLKRNDDILFVHNNQPIRLPSKKVCFIMFICSFILGPFLDGYHSAFRVLSYNTPHPFYLGNMRLFFTDVWVPPLFGIAGTIMSVLYIVLDQILETDKSKQIPAWSKVFLGISFFSFQYWASGYLSYDEPLITDDLLWNILFYSGILGFFLFDFTVTGFIVSMLTAISGPLVEIILINQLHLYHYLRPNFWGIPLWIIPIYFLGGQAVGNLARAMKKELENEYL